MLAAIRSFSKKELTVPVQKLVLQLTVMCEADSLAEAIQAYSNMDLEQIEESIKFGEDIGSGVSIVSSETIDDREKIKAALLAIGNDGTFFDLNLDVAEIGLEAAAEQGG